MTDQILDPDFALNNPIVVFDLDGVIFHTPSQDTIHDRYFWTSYWSDPDRQKPNREMASLLQSLPRMGRRVLILTARPIEYRPQTEEALMRAGIRVTYGHSVISRFTHPVLFMWDGDAPWGNGPWKKRVIERWIECGADIAWMIEDYKPNADAIRTLCPVLLYERQK